MDDTRPRNDDDRLDQLMAGLDRLQRSLDSDVVNLHVEVNRLRGRVEQQVSELGNRLDRLESHRDADVGYASTYLQGLHRQVDELDQRLQQLEGRHSGS